MARSRKNVTEPVRGTRAAPRHLRPAAEPPISPRNIRQAVESILRRTRIDRRWDIPYLAGYSRGGRVIYIDRHLPRTFRYRGRRVRVDPFLILHEAVEIALLDKLDLAYQDAHVMALLAERGAVEAAGLPWAPYERFMSEHIKRAGSKKLARVPRHLSLVPYLDEKDLELLQDMLPLMYVKWEG